MSANVIELTNQALSLPIAERMQLAQKLWESLPDASVPPQEDAEAVELARRRDAELASG